MRSVQHLYSHVLCHEKPARVIMAVPHDGFAVEQVRQPYKRRTHGTCRQDKHAWSLAESIIGVACENDCAIDAVRFMAPRAYVDPNRPLTCRDVRKGTALTDARLRPLYDRYHDEIGWLLHRSIRSHGAERVLFLDIHNYRRSHRVQPDDFDIYLGTKNRRTIFYEDVDIGFAMFMQERQYSVFLPGTLPVGPSCDPLNGGYTTRKVAEDFRINSLQIEFFEEQCWDDSRRLSIAMDVAEFLVANYS